MHCKGNKTWDRHNHSILYILDLRNDIEDMESFVLTRLVYDEVRVYGFLR
jgi:hypothetical protein